MAAIAQSSMALRRSSASSWAIGIKDEALRFLKQYATRLAEDDDDAADDIAVHSGLLQT